MNRHGKLKAASHLARLLFNWEQRWTDEERSWAREAAQAWGLVTQKETYRVDLFDGEWYLLWHFNDANWIWIHRITYEQWIS